MILVVVMISKVVNVLDMIFIISDFEWCLDFLVDILIGCGLWFVIDG